MGYSSSSISLGFSPSGTGLTVYPSLPLTHILTSSSAQNGSLTSHRPSPTPACLDPLLPQPRTPFPHIPQQFQVFLKALASLPSEKWPWANLWWSSPSFEYKILHANQSCSGPWLALPNAHLFMRMTCCMDLKIPGAGEGC